MNITIVDTAGQWTPILEGNYSESQKVKTSRLLLKKYPLVGQVAFIDTSGKIPGVTMMGGELSINGAIAAGYVLKRPFTACNLTIIPTNKSTIFPSAIIKKVYKNEVILTGIKYQIIKSINVNLNTARLYCNQDLAAGFMIEKRPSEIIPIVYVRATDTLITETACGSASLAYFLLTGISRVQQPSGQYITIYKNSATLSVSTTIKEIIL